MDPVSTSNDAGEGPQTLVFTPNQIACVCNVLMEKGDYERLTKFMLSLPNDKSLYQNEDVVRAQCVALFHINDFKGLYSTLENHSFSSEHHQFLQVTAHLGRSKLHGLFERKNSDPAVWTNHCLIEKTLHYIPFYRPFLTGVRKSKIMF